MDRPATVAALEELGRIRLSSNFFMRDFLHSEIADVHGLPNIPHNPELAIEAGRQLCETLLEPLQASFGRLHIRSAYRSPEVNSFGNEHDLGCAGTEANYAHHIWDYRDPAGHLGATACIVIPWVWDRFRERGDWQRLAWWIHDHLPYGKMSFFPKLWAFNLQWHESPARIIAGYTDPQGILTRPGMENHTGSHSEWYSGFPVLKDGKCTSTPRGGA